MRAATSISGIAAAVAMLILGTFFLGSIDVLMDQQFFVIQRQHLMADVNRGCGSTGSGRGVTFTGAPKPLAKAGRIPR